MLKVSLRISAALAIIFGIGLAGLMYIPVWNEFGKVLIRTMGGDKVVHVLIGATMPLALAFLAKLYQASKRLQWAFWFACLFLFVGDEFVQSFSAERSADIQDLAMSSLGWVIGCSLWWLIWLIQRDKLEAAD